MDQLILDFLNTKYSGQIHLIPNQSTEGMPALLCDIFYSDNSKIGRYSYFFETKKGHMTPSVGLEDCLRGYFNIGHSDLERLLSTWIGIKLPSLKPAIEKTRLNSDDKKWKR